MKNTISSLLKSCAFSAAFIGTSASADTYKLEIKQEANAVLRFCIENIDKKSHDVLGIQPSGGVYNLLDGGCGDIIDELCVGTGVEFKIGSFAVLYDGANKRIKLSGGCAEDSLILYQCSCGIFIENGTELKPNTLIVQKSGSSSFKNEGILEAFITYFEDCKSVENKGNFTSRNLFLLRTDIQNYGMVSWCDAYHNIDGNVKNLVGNNGKNGFIKMGKKTGNTILALNASISQYTSSYCATTISTDSGRIVCTLNEASNSVTSNQNQTIWERYFIAQRERKEVEARILKEIVKKGGCNHQ